MGEGGILTFKNDEANSRRAAKSFSHTCSFGIYKLKENKKKTTWYYLFDCCESLATNHDTNRNSLFFYLCRFLLIILRFFQWKG